MSTKNFPLSRLRYHVTGAIERGEAQAIIAEPMTEKVLDFIRSHGNLCFALPSGEIRTREVFSGPGAITLRTARQWQTIPATIQAAKDFLGY